MTSEFTASVFVIDDDDALRERLARAFRERGFDARDAGDIPAAATAIQSRRFTYAVVDLRLPSGTGLDVVRMIRHASPETVIVVLTGYGSIATALEAVRLGATHYLQKPASIDDILGAFALADREDEGGAEVEQPDDTTEVPSLDRVEWEHINRVLMDCDGNVSEAARRLGLHRRSLQRKLAKYPTRR